MSNREMFNGDQLEELIGQIRIDGSTDSAHIHEFVRAEIERERNNILEYIEGERNVIEENLPQNAKDERNGFNSALQLIADYIKGDNK